MSFNSLQVGYKLRPQRGLLLRPNVSIPYRQATNEQLLKEVRDYFEPFQFLIGRLQTHFHSFQQPAQCFCFNSLQVGYKQVHHRIFPILEGMFQFLIGRLQTIIGIFLYTHSIIDVSIPYRQATNRDLEDYVAFRFCVSIPYRQATNRFIRSFSGSVYISFNSLQVGYKRDGALKGGKQSSSGFNSLQVGYKLEMCWVPLGTFWCFNSLQVGYKPQGSNRSSACKIVSIPYRQATNLLRA